MKYYIHPTNPVKTDTKGLVALMAFGARKKKRDAANAAIKSPSIVAEDGFVDPVAVTITHPNPNAVIYWTNNGSDPSDASALYSGSFNLTGSASWTVKAIAYLNGKASAVATLLITREVVADPVFSPNGGTVYEPANVTLTCATAGATIRYTTNGTTPSPSVGTIYAGAFAVSSDMTVKAIAYKTGRTNSAVISKTFNVSGYNIYYGVSADAVLDETDIYALAGQNNLENPEGTYVFDAQAPEKYLYIAWKASLGWNPVAGTGFSNDLGSLMNDMADEAPYDNTINGWTYDLVSVGGEDYWVFRTKYTQALAMNIHVVTESAVPAP